MTIPALIRSVLATAAILFLASIANAAPFISGSYYEENVSQTCENFNACEIHFSSIPTGKSVTIKRISCHLTGPSPGVFHTVYLGILRPGLSQPERLQFFPPGTPVLAGTTNVQNFNEVTHWPIGGGSRPALGIQFNTISTTNIRECQISGEISPP